MPCGQAALVLVCRLGRCVFLGSARFSGGIRLVNPPPPPPSIHPSIHPSTCTGFCCGPILPSLWGCASDVGVATFGGAVPCLPILASDAGPTMAWSAARVWAGVWHRWGHGYGPSYLGGCLAASGPRGPGPGGNHGLWLFLLPPSCCGGLACPNPARRELGCRTLGD